MTAPDSKNNPLDTGAKKPGKTLILIIVIVLLIGAFVGIYAFSVSDNGQTKTTTNICDAINSIEKAPGIANATINAATATFTIIESDPGNNYEGMNGSAFHVSTQWPVIQVYQGQKVIINIFNCASSESHGFAITTYFNSGVTVRPGQSYTLTFVANQKGSFRMYCSIFCAIHPLMQNGVLIVLAN